MAITQIPSEFISTNAISGTIIADNAITAVHIATNAVSGTLIADNAVTAVHIATNAISGTLIADNAVTAVHVAGSSITATQIEDNAIGTGQLAGIARGKIIYGDSSGDPQLLALGSNGQVLKSDGSDITWGSISQPITALNNATENELVTVGATTTELEAESGLTWDTNTLTISGTITVGDGHTIGNDGDDNLVITGSASENIIIDSADDIILDAAGADISLKVAATTYGKFNLSGNNLNIHSSINNADIVFKGEDNSSTITALTLDMSDAGAAHFNSRVGIGVASHATAGLNITNTSQHIRLNNGSELGIINLDSDGILDLWAHGDGESMTFRTGTGSGTVAMSVVGTNVGIGTTGPSAPLDVVVDSSVWTGEFTQSNTSNGDGVLVQVGSTAAADYALSIRSDAGNTSVLAAKADGKVGIGTFSPTHSLHVLTTDSKGFLLDRNSGSNAANLNEFSTHYSLSIKTRANGSYLNFAGDAAYSALQATDGAGSATAKNLHLNPWGGRVGIGTGVSTPGATLHVDASGGANFQVSRTGVADMFYVEADGTNAVIRNPGSNDLVFQFGGATEKIRFDGGTGTITATGGATSSPTYSFQGDTNTGISRPTADAVNMVVGGAEKLRLDYLGNLTVGAPSPGNGMGGIFTAGPLVQMGTYGSEEIGMVSGDTTHNEANSGWNFSSSTGVTGSSSTIRWTIPDTNNGSNAGWGSAGGYGMVSAYNAIRCHFAWSLYHNSGITGANLTILSNNHSFTLAIGGNGYNGFYIEADCGSTMTHAVAQIWVANSGTTDTGAWTNLNYATTTWS